MRCLSPTALVGKARYPLGLSGLGAVRIRVMKSKSIHNVRIRKRPLPLCATRLIRCNIITNTPAIKQRENESLSINYSLLYHIIVRIFISELYCTAGITRMQDLHCGSRCHLCSSLFVDTEKYKEQIYITYTSAHEGTLSSHIVTKTGKKS